MDATNNIATDLFYKIRSRFSGLKLGESTGNITINPEDARFFDFDYTENDKKLGHISISLAEPNSMKVYFSSGISEGMDSDQKDNWYGFLRELRKFAKRRLLAFDTRDITKDNLDKRDYAFLSQHSAPKSDNDTIVKPVGETIMSESNLYGTKTQSFQKLLDTRLIIKHSKKLADDFEQKPGDRSRNISALFVENQDGERFKYPFIHLAGARAMQRHVANGGLPYDAIGESIIKMSEEIAQLKSFTNYCVRNDLMNSDTNSIVERSKAQLDGLRERVARLSKQAHYENYVTEFQAPEAVEVPDDVMEEYKEKFTVKNFKEDIANAFPIIYRLMKEEESVGYDDIVGMKEADETEETEEEKVSEDPMTDFESWVNNLGEESPIVMADENEKADLVKKLNELVGQEFSAGVDGTNAIQSLEGIIEDPKLEQDIKKKATEDANIDVRPLVKAWVEENAPDVLGELDFGDMAADQPAVGADEVEPQQEASGYEGQDEPQKHTIDIEGDYDEDRGIGEKECSMMEKELEEKGIKAACEPNEMRQGSVVIHTMSPKEAVLDALEQAGYTAEAFEGEVAEGGLSDVMIGAEELISDYTNAGDKESGLKMPKDKVIDAIKGEKADAMEIMYAVQTIESDFDDKGNYKYAGQDDMPEGQGIDEAMVSLDQARDYFFDKHDFADENIQGEYDKMASKMSPEDAETLKKELEEFYPDVTFEGNEFAQKVRQMKAAGAKKGTKFKTSDGEEHTLEGLAEFITSFYDRNTGTFPKGPEGVCVMVGKKFGEQAEKVARKFVERMAPAQEQGAEDLEELERIKSLIQY